MPRGVDVKIISGDDVRTVAKIAETAGVRDAQRCIDATTLKEEDMEDAVERYTVFGRVSPMQKKQMIEALKRKGHVTAMTGDGVNDVMALKEADCSIAMAQGSEAAKNIANLVLLDSSFSHLPEIVNEGTPRHQQYPAHGIAVSGQDFIFSHPGHPHAVFDSDLSV